jgi:hypothetical protein
VAPNGPDEWSGIRLARTHGLFNLVSGLWPLVSLRSFEWVFGPKEDTWLVQTVAGLLTVNGVSQLLASPTEGVAHARRVGLGTAATLLAIDLIYVPRRRIRPTYLVDAAVEAVWIAAWLRRGQSPASRCAKG